MYSFCNCGVILSNCYYCHVVCCVDAGWNSSAREHAGEDKGRAAETAGAGDRQVSNDLYPVLTVLGEMSGEHSSAPCVGAC